MMEALGHEVSALLLKSLESEVSHVDSQPYLCNRASIKTLDTKAQVSFLAGILSHISAGKSQSCL